MIKTTIEIKRERQFRFDVISLCEKFRVKFFHEIIDENIIRLHKLKINCEFRNLIEYREFIDELDKIINY